MAFELSSHTIRNIPLDIPKKSSNLIRLHTQRTQVTESVSISFKRIGARLSCDLIY